jgi:hypothetical protein
MVSSISSFDDALAWSCIQELVSAINQRPIAATSNTSMAAIAVRATSPRLRDLEEDSGSGDTDSPAVTNLEPDEPPASTVETRALTLPRGALLLTLISLLPSVNLVLLRSLLTEISRLVDLEPAEHDGRRALGQWTFEVLGSGMDVVKREEGVRWWLEHGAELLDGKKVEGNAEKDDRSEVIDEKVEVHEAREEL